MPELDTSTFKLDLEPKVVTFDRYGTLVRWCEVLLREVAATPMTHGQDE